MTNGIINGTTKGTTNGTISKQKYEIFKIQTAT
jgi:hypothetical protein